MNDAVPIPTTSSRLVRRYQRQMLAMLLLRRLGQKDVESCAGKTLELIWEHCSTAEQDQIDAWVRCLPSALREHGPQVRDDWDRASGLAECQICGLSYHDHPTDPREACWLHVSCNGRRWKL